MASLTLHFEDVWVGLPLMAKGFLFTVLLAAVSFSGALLFGTMLGVLREEKKGWPGRAAGLYIEFLRGIPLILFLLFIHYGLMPTVFGHSDFLGSSLLAFFLFESAYVGEIIRGGLRSVTRSERESAKSLGLTETQQLWHVILPLAFQRMMPALAGQLVSLIKDTSLASIVGVIELTRAGEIIYEQRFHDFEILAFQAVVYFLVCYSIARLSRCFEPAEHQAESILSQTLS
ncbi:MAG TPA: amino acid ABC transporter permease [Coleofasciculaceae cyanobacterium]|jgi:putative glutamine transport system permease protein